MRVPLARWVRPLAEDRWLLCLVGAGLLVRVGLALWLDPVFSPRGDESTYTAYATMFQRKGMLETGDFVRPPLYFVLLAGVRGLTDATGLPFRLTVRLLQCLVSIATALPVYHTARRVGGVRAARVAAGFLLFDPSLVGFSHLLWPETCFLFLIALLWNGLAGIEEKGRGARAGLGLLLGLAMLLKPVAGLFALLLAGSWLLRHGFAPALRLCLVVGGVAALVVLPWVVRNQLRFGPSILLENQVAYNVWTGNDPSRPTLIWDEWTRLRDPVLRQSVGWQRGLDAIGADPVGFGARTARHALNLWGLEFFVVRHAVIGGYGPLDRGAVLRVFWLLQLGYAAALLAAALGLRATFRDPTLRVVLVYAVVFTALVSTMIATTRFRVPFAFPLVVAAGLGVDRALAGRLTRRDLVAAGLALLVLCLSAAQPIFRTLGGGRFEETSELAREDWRFFRY